MAVDKGKKVELIYVVPMKEDGRVAFHEKHEDHPNGEVWIAGDAQEASVTEPVVVARTSAVSRALGIGRLREVPGKVDVIEIPDTIEAPEGMEIPDEIEIEIEVEVDSYKDLKKAELVELLEDRMIDFPKRASKAKLVALLEQDDLV